MPLKTVIGGLLLATVIAIAALAWYAGFPVLSIVTILCLSTYYMISIMVQTFTDKPWKWDVPFVLMYAIFLIFSFAVNYLGIHGLEVSASHEKVTNLRDSMYFSVSTWTTLGYGDIVALGNAKWIAMIEALVGYLTSALIIALIVDRLQHRRPRR